MMEYEVRWLEHIHLNEDTPAGFMRKLQKAKDRNEPL